MPPGSFCCFCSASRHKLAAMKALDTPAHGTPCPTASFRKQREAAGHKKHHRDFSSVVLKSGCSSAIQSFQIGHNQHGGDHKCDPIRKWGGSCNSGNAHALVQQQHKHNVQAAFAKQGLKQRLHFFADGLKNRDAHKIDGGGGAGQADDFQKVLPIPNRFRIGNEAARNGRGKKVSRGGGPGPCPAPGDTMPRRSTANGYSGFAFTTTAWGK